MQINPIGVIHTPNIQAQGAPLQPVYASGIEGTVEVFEPFVEGLKDLEGFDRIWLLFWCHRAVAPKLSVVPYRSRQELGLFATRIPARPNPIGISSVRLIRIEGGILHVKGVDMLDGSPLIDIKPYVPDYDIYPIKRVGWLENCDQTITNADSRFERSDA